MTESRSPKFIGTKLGLVSALALGSLPLIGSEALAIPVGVASDTLQIGTGTTFTIPENGSEPTTITTGAVSISTDLGFIPTSLTATIALLDPGSTTSISDIVTASLTCAEGEAGTIPGVPCLGATLTVMLTSDGETPLAPPSGSFAKVTEAGTVQDLSSNFDMLFGLPNGETVPAINVLSDVEAVPEPASLALLGSGLAGLAFVRRRRKA